MKYIRTEDEIYKYDDFFDIEWYKANDYTEEEMIKTAKDYIVNQADTIEELCDEFVCDHFISNNTKDLRDLRPNGLIYGAIWTDKGLIYVAKMNDKGELELL